MRFLITFCFIILILCASLAAQSEYLSKGYSGFGFSLDVAAGEGNSAYGASFGVATNGIMSFGANYSRIASSSNRIYRNADKGVFSIVTDLMPFNGPKSTTQLALEGGASVIINDDSEPVFYILPYLLMNSKNARGSNMLFRIGVGYSGSANNNISSTAAFALGLSYYHTSKNDNIFFIGLTVSRQNNLTTVGADIGGVLARLASWKGSGDF